MLYIAKEFKTLDYDIFDFFSNRLHEFFFGIWLLAIVFLIISIICFKSLLRFAKFSSFVSNKWMPKLNNV